MLGFGSLKIAVEGAACKVGSKVEAKTVEAGCLLVDGSRWTDDSIEDPDEGPGCGALKIDQS